MGGRRSRDLQGVGNGDQIMADGPAKDALRAQIEALIALVDAALAA